MLCNLSTNNLGSNLVILGNGYIGKAFTISPSLSRVL
jgi:hypothetical protein